MVHLDPASPVPIYEQIAEQFRRLIARGALETGDRLPTVRELAARLRVNRNTAARAIRKLQSQGVVRTQVGKGTFVESAAPRVDRKHREAILTGLIERLLVEAHSLGVPLDQLAPLLTERIDAFARSSEPQPECDDGAGDDHFA
jgi:GntR family transcriptional regulator